MKLFVLLLMISLVKGKIILEKWELQHDPRYSEVKYELKDHSSMSIDAHALGQADDITIDAAVYSKVDGVFNPFVRPDPMKICVLHEHEDPLIKYIHDEVNRFGNITKACPVVKGMNYYMHDFVLDEIKFPMPLPLGEFRVDINASIVEAGKVIHLGSSELYFKTVME